MDEINTAVCRSNTLDSILLAQSPLPSLRITKKMLKNNTLSIGGDVCNGAGLGPRYSSVVGLDGIDLESRDFNALATSIQGALVQMGHKS